MGMIGEVVDQALRLLAFSMYCWALWWAADQVLGLSEMDRGFELLAFGFYCLLLRHLWEECRESQP